ncbi:replication factor A protein [Trifolium repens]|nr:replication factor A protein [Trifolium repens]
MAPKHDSISDISPAKENWNLIVRVVRLWYVKNTVKDKLPFSIEMVLMDSKADRIHATLSGSRYVPQNLYLISHPAEIFSGRYDTDYLVDLMGMLTAVDVEKTYQRNGAQSKNVVIELDHDGYRFKCTLFGAYVDMLNAFLASGKTDNVVVVILLAKVKILQGRAIIQNTIYSTKLLFNPVYSAAVDLKKKMVENNDTPLPGITQLQDNSNVSLIEDFMQDRLYATIEGLKKSRDEGVFVVCATVKLIVDDNDWWYERFLLPIWLWRLWKSIERKEHAEVVTTNLVLMDCYAQKIQATIGRELSAKFVNVLREDNVYVMYNFKVELNELEVRTNTHKYILNFTNDTKVKCVHNGFLPIYSYFFTHPNVFLNHKYNPAVLVDVIGMLTNVAVENDYLIDGEMKKIVSMDLTNHGHSFKCILHGRCIDQLNDFLLSGNSDNAVVALFFGKIEIWKGVPVVQNTTTYTNLLFNPNLDATLDLKQRMLGSHFTPYKNMLPMSQDTKEHILDQWVYSNVKSSVSTPTVDPLQNINFTDLDLLHGGTSIQRGCGVVGSGEGKTNGRLAEVTLTEHVFGIPCGHVAGCMSCLNEVKTKKWGCPVCRAKIDQIIKLYHV